MGADAETPAPEELEPLPPWKLNRIVPEDGADVEGEGMDRGEDRSERYSKAKRRFARPWKRRGEYRTQAYYAAKQE